MSMSNELEVQLFEGLPNRVKVSLESIARGPGPRTEAWLREEVGALGGKSVLQVLAEDDSGELRVIAYCNAVKERFS